MVLKKSHTDTSLIYLSKISQCISIHFLNKFNKTGPVIGLEEKVRNMTKIISIEFNRGNPDPKSGKSSPKAELFIKNRVNC